MVVTISLCVFVSDQMWYNLESVPYLYSVQCLNSAPYRDRGIIKKMIINKYMRYISFYIYLIA